MTRLACLPLLIAVGLFAAAQPPEPAAPAPVADTAFKDEIAPLLNAHCVKCHSADTAKGDVRLDDLTADVSKDAARWAAVRDQLRDGLMPPPKESRIPDAKARATVAWITSKVGDPALKLPNQGNLIPHELLFGKPAGPVAAVKPGSAGDRPRGEDDANSVAILDFPNWFWIVGLGLSLRGN